MNKPLLSIVILMSLLALGSQSAKSQEMFGWWPLNDGAGDTATDISGNDIPATINNVDFGGLGDGDSAWAEDPEFGTVLSFNGVDNSGAYAVVGNPPDSGTLPIFTTEADSEFTWSFWAKSEQGANNSIILGNRRSSTGGDFSPRQFIKFTTRMFEWDTNNVQSVDYEDIPQGIWIHHVIVKSGAELTYYRDGIESGSRAIVAAPQDPQPIYFGGQVNECWAGYMSDVRLYNNALSEAEIQIVYENRGIFSTEDDDEDGLPDAWEEALVDNLEDLNGNAAGPGPGSGTGDFDGDGLTDLDEYEETKTDPTKKDTDEDGLSDATETNTGTFVSATNTGTNPKKADTDGDGLVDSVETNTGELVDEENTGTDPNNPDSDGDGYSDGGEIVGGTDPNDENSKGSIPAPILYVDFEDGAVDSTDQGNDGDVNGNITFDAEGAERGSTPSTAGDFNGGYINFPGVDLSGIIQDIEGENSYTLSAWIKPSDLGGNKFLWGQTSQGIHNGIRNGGFLHQAHWGADTNGATNLSAFDGEWIHAAWVYDGDSDIGIIYLNGEVDWEGGKRAPNGSGNLIVGGSNGGGDNYRGLVDDVAVWMEALPAGSIKSLAEGVSPIGRTDDDSDGDGLPDFYEEKLVDNLEDLNGNGAGPGPGAGTGDFDGDGLTDLDEYEETKTDPTKADTDGDGLSDAVETNTGTYVSATNTGTNPKSPDSDSDGLLDGVETNTGELVDEENTGTDPNNADSDGDGYKDGGEIAGGTDPNDENSKGALPPPLLYVDFESEATDLSGNDYNGEVDGDVTFDVEGAEGGPTPTTGASFNGGHLDFFDIDMNSMIRDFEDGSYTFACWMKPIGSAGGQGFMWGQTNQGIHNGIRNGGLLHSAHWGADWNASTVLEADQWVHAAWTYDGVNDEATIYLNGEIDGGPTPQRAANGGGTFIFGGRNNGELAYNGYVDDIAIWTEVLPEGSIQALADGISPIGATQEDDDGDGLPDAWEEKYGVDDPEGDDDNDGLTNVEEFELRTKPNKADSDEDGLSDKAETEVHKTNPLNPDADKDGLLDGQEIAAGTDPANRDTDEDGITDFDEIENGTDPLVKTAISFDNNLVAYWPMDGSFDNAQTDDYHGIEEGGPIEFQTGKFGDSVYLNGSQSIEIGGDENVFDFTGESFTVSAWYTAEEISKSWQCLVAKGEGNGWRVHRRGGDQPPEMTFTGGNGDVDRHNVAMEVGGDPETWHHVAGVTDSSTNEQILYLDGEEVARKSGATLQDRNNPMRIGDNPDARNRNWQGKVDDVAVWGRALAPFEIADIWNNGDGKSIEEMLGLAIPFEFTSIIYNAEEDGFRLEWNSKPNKTYALYFSESLEEFDADIDDSIESQGETTVYPGEDEWLPNPLEGAPKLFFRIEENQ